jgi:hypothetical protein
METFDWKKPETHPNRYHDAVVAIHAATAAMNQEQRLGAAKVLNVLADYFWQAHFEKQAVLNQKAVVKTIDEIRENLLEDYYHNGHEEDIPMAAQSDPQQ